jgi:hypothetical protein
MDVAKCEALEAGDTNYYLVISHWILLYNGWVAKFRNCTDYLLSFIW